MAGIGEVDDGWSMSDHPVAGGDGLCWRSDRCRRWASERAGPLILDRPRCRRLQGGIRPEPRQSLRPQFRRSIGADDAVEPRNSASTSCETSGGVWRVLTSRLQRPRTRTAYFQSGSHRTTMASTMLSVNIDRSDPLPLHDQVAAEIRRAIAEGEAGPGERLPWSKTSRPCSR